MNTKLFLLAPILALSVGCDAVSSAAAQGLGLPSSPQAATNRTQLDENLLTGLELAYKAARIAVEIKVDSGQCTGTCATRFRDLNRRAFAALGAARTAYRAANAPGYLAALAEARGLANDILTLTGRNN